MIMTAGSQAWTPRLHSMQALEEESISRAEKEVFKTSRLLCSEDPGGPVSHQCIPKTRDAADQPTNQNFQGSTFASDHVLISSTTFVKHIRQKQKGGGGEVSGAE